MSVSKQTSVSTVVRCLLTVSIALTLWSETAVAAFGDIPENSEFDMSVLQVDEKAFLGTKVSGDYVLQRADETTFRLGDLPSKPLILVLSYFTCDGACSVINKTLATTLQDVKRWTIGKDYNVLTLSFDRNDTPATMRAFMEKMGFKDQLPKGWQMATMQSREDIDRLTQSIGFKFFWSASDRRFLHPSLYTLLAPDGRVSRYLYAGRVGPKDIEIALTKAMKGEIAPANIIDFIIAACYSYNYKDGKYKLNLPLFIALGALVGGFGMIVGGYFIMRKRRKRDGEQIVTA